MRVATLVTALLATSLAGCATVKDPPKRVEAPVSQAEQQSAQESAAMPDAKRLKRKIAVGRFTNETNYGRTLFRDEDGNPLGKQAADMLAARLVQSGQFIVFERPDLGSVLSEQSIAGNGDLVGVDALVVGSVTEFGRATTGETGFLSSTKKQTARAKVEARLVDVRTGLVFFSTSGAGAASTEAGDVAGFGSRAAYDATLNDRAIAAAVSDLLTNIMNKLDERAWQTDILKVDGQRVFISGGGSQGLALGDELKVMRRGETIRSSQSGLMIELPGEQVATIRIESFFGDSEYAEGSIARVASGTIPASEENLYVTEIK